MRRQASKLAAALVALSLGSGAVLAKPKPKKKPTPAASQAPSPTPPEPASPAPAPAAAPPAAPSPPEPPTTPAEPERAPAPAPKKSAVELDALVNEYGAIRDELFRSRAKAAVLGEALLKTQLAVTFRYEAGRAWPLKKVSLRLDERPVFAAESVSGNEPQKIFETVAAPGHHVLSARVEAAGTGEERIGYATETSFAIDLADGKLTRVELIVDENGSGPAPLAKKKQGSFDLRVKANVKSLEPEKK